jgi:xylulokinase
MAQNILVCDIGLTNCKTVLFDRDGRSLARVSVPYPTHRPCPGWVEQDPEDWWRAFTYGVAQLRERVPSDLGSVVAVSVTGHMHSLVCLGPEGSTLGRAMVLGDQRAIREARAISVELGLERIYRLTGARIDASMPVAKLRWLRHNSPDIHSGAHAFLCCKDWLRHRLTGDLLTDPVDACGTSLYDIQSQSWAPDLMELAGVSSSQLPEVIEPCAIAGPLKEAAARALGLPAGIPIVVGAGDDVEVLGNGLLGPGRALEHLGTTGSILTAFHRPVYDPLMAIELYPHVLPDRWVLGGSITAAGAALAWADEILSRGDRQGVWAANWPQHPDLERPLVFVPHISGERCPAWQPHARGAWIGLTPVHTAQDLRRAVLEGVAFALKGVLQRIESLVGQQHTICVSGRELDDDGWLALRASVYDRPLALVNTSEPTALGAMVVGAVGAGLYASVADAVRQVTGDERMVEPREDLCDDYRRLYALYRTGAEAVGQATACWANDEQEKV